MGGASVTAWGFAFMHLTLILLVGPVAFMILKPRDLEGDRGTK
jgi:hypothetical protein